MMRNIIGSWVAFCFLATPSRCFQQISLTTTSTPRPVSRGTSFIETAVLSSINGHDQERPPSRREFFVQTTTATASAILASFLPTDVSNANEFTPGGTLVDYTVGVTVGNKEASSSRAVDNSNTLFDRDYYFKFGTAAPWIEPDSVDFPKTMPFTPSQQRYDALKKYKSRILSGIDYITKDLKEQIKSGSGAVLDASAPEYQLRPMGLLANSFIASENTGTTNELLLIRWYINEMYLAINDIRKDLANGDGSSAEASYRSLYKAINSYFAMLNRVITSKVGDKFAYLEVP